MIFLLYTGESIRKKLKYNNVILFYWIDYIQVWAVKKAASRHFASASADQFLCARRFRFGDDESRFNICV